MEKEGQEIPFFLFLFNFLRRLGFLWMDISFGALKFEIFHVEGFLTCMFVCMYLQ